jgi:hypothetical protein
VITTAVIRFDTASLHGGAALGDRTNNIANLPSMSGEFLLEQVSDDETASPMFRRREN